MFSKEFGVERTSADTAETQLMDIEDFLASKFVICQSHRVNDRGQLIFQPICLWSMGDMKREYKQRQDQYSVAPQEAIQTVVHRQTHEGLVFIAIDPFNSHHFTLDDRGQTFSPFTTYVGNNETQLLLSNLLINQNLDDGRRDD